MPEVIITGPSGRLEGRYHRAEAHNAPIALVLHPHPMYGGTMNNKVVYETYHSFVEKGFTTLRFNFRGVGRSQGTYDDGIGELTDAATALDWMQLQTPDACACWIAGFSFGAWIAMQLMMRRPEIEGFISVSPPANIYDFSFLAPCPASGLVTMGNRDDVVKLESVDRLVGKLTTQRNVTVDYQVIEGADHYYRETRDEFKTTLDDYLESRADEYRKRRRNRPERKRRTLPKTG